MRARDLAALGILALLLALLAVTPPARWLEGLSYDTALLLRHKLFGPEALPDQSRAVVVALDEETYRRPPFQAVPQAAWTPHLAVVLKAVLAGGAGAVGFDLVYPTSLEGMQRGYDRDFLLALRQAAREGKLVLGKVQHGTQAIEPHPMQLLAVGGAGNVRALNVLEDPDGIIRRIPLDFAAADPGQREPSFAVELARRLALNAMPPVPQAGEMLLAFNTAPGDIPTYSLADLLACAEAGDTAYFERHFSGKAVIFATVLDVEDRRLTTKRLTTAPDGANAPPRCRLEPMLLARADLARDSIPGVYIHATAINNLLADGAWHEVSSGVRFALALLLALAMIMAAFRLPLAVAASAAAALVLVLPLAAAFLLLHHLALPWLTLEAVMLLALGGGTAYRITVTDQDKRLIARLFALYLPGSVIDGMLRSGRLPALGGEEREVTVLFSDIAGFTRISESTAPAALVQALNGYFSTMTEIIEAHGGFVDKFIGDAIVAVFGAPAENPDHAAQAVRAALRMRDVLRAEPERYGINGLPFKTRIGLNTGRVLIGNIGSPRRFNYTVIGDAVNLAARLEGANKYYGTAVLTSDATQAAAGAGLCWRPIDRVRVVGRERPVAVFEPLNEAEAKLATDFTNAWEAIARRDFKLAEGILRGLGPEPGAEALLTRLQLLAEAPPAPWPPVTDMTSK